MSLDLSYAIYMHNPDNSSGSFVAFRTLVVPHTAYICRLHTRVFGDRVCALYCLLATLDFALRPPEHFSLFMSEYGFSHDGHDGLLSAHSFAESAHLVRLTYCTCCPSRRTAPPTIRSLTPAERAIDLDVLLACLATALNLEHLMLLNAVP